MTNTDIIKIRDKVPVSSFFKKVAEGIIGNALSFDGFDDFVQFQSSPSFDIGGDKVTVSLWAKMEYKPTGPPCALW